MTIAGRTPRPRSSGLPPPRASRWWARAHGDLGGADGRHTLADPEAAELGVLHGMRRRAMAAVDQADEVRGDPLELGPGEGHLNVPGPGGVRGDEGQGDPGLTRGRERGHGPLRGLDHSHQGERIHEEVNPLAALAAASQPVDDTNVEPVTRTWAWWSMYPVCGASTV